jgi:hypothetical protein
MIEVMAALVTVAAIGAIGYVTISNTKISADSEKLASDVASINRSIQIYLASGGSTDALTGVEPVLNELKKRPASPTTLGVTGSTLDARVWYLASSASDDARAVWNNTSKRFEVVQGGGAGVKQFTLDEDLASSAPATDTSRTAVKTTSSANGGWVWDHSPAVEAASVAGASPVTTSAAGAALGGATLAELSAPTFSPGGGTSALSGFPRTVTITNPNSAGTSQIYYSTGGAYILYSGPVSISPGPLSAVAVTLDPARYATSPTRSETYVAQVALTWNATASAVTYSQVASGNYSASVAADGSGPFMIGYTTDGTTPTAASAAYTSALTLSPGMWTSATLTLSAKALVAAGNPYYVDSEVATITIAATPTALSAPSISPGSQIVFGTTFVTITKAATSPAGTRIYYTTTGITPTVAGGTLYWATFYLSPPGMNAQKYVKAIAAGPTGLDFWFTPSGVASVTYTGLNFDYYNLEGVLIGGGTINNNASLDGSVVLVASSSVQPNVTFDNNSSLTGDIYAPGTPTVIGVPADRVVNLDGAVDPTSYTITMNKADFTGKVYRRITPVRMPVITLPTGLVERGAATAGTLQPGHYTSLNGENGGTFTLGVAGSTTPSVYVVDRLSVGNGARINIVGPVTLVLNPGPNNTVSVSNNAFVGNSAHPEWLNVDMYTGNLEVGNNGFLYGTVLAPNGSVLFDNNSVFIGGVTAKFLNISNNGAGLTFSLPPPTSQ